MRIFERIYFSRNFYKTCRFYYTFETLFDGINPNIRVRRFLNFLSGESEDNFFLLNKRPLVQLTNFGLAPKTRYCQNSIGIGSPSVLDVSLQSEHIYKLLWCWLVDFITRFLPKFLFLLYWHFWAADCYLQNIFEYAYDYINDIAEYGYRVLSDFR